MRRGLAWLVASSLMASLVYPATTGAESVKGQAEVGNVQAKSLHSSVSYNDLTGHWSQSAVTRLQDLNLLKGYTDGTFKPNQVISRAEFVMILDRAFGFTGNATTDSYADLSSDDWYHDVMVRANGSGIIEGTDREHLSPKQPITRQDAAVMVDRAFQLSTAMNEDSDLSKFQDADDISSYSKKALTYLVNENMIKGFQGKLNPKAPITRAETAQLLSAMIADVKNAPGVYESRVDGNFIVNSTDVTLKNTVINGNLLLAEGIGEGTVVLQGVTVTGSVIIKGGGSHSIDISNSKLNRVVVDKRGEPVRVAITEESTIQEIVVMQQSILDISSNSLIDTMNILAGANQTRVDSKGTIQQLSVDANDVVINGEKVKRGLRTSMTGEVPQPASSQPGGQRACQIRQRHLLQEGRHHLTHQHQAILRVKNRCLLQRFRMINGNSSGMMSSTDLRLMPPNGPCRIRVWYIIMSCNITARTILALRKIRIEVYCRLKRKKERKTVKITAQAN